MLDFCSVCGAHNRFAAHTSIEGGLAPKEDMIARAGNTCCTQPTSWTVSVSGGGGGNFTASDIHEICCDTATSEMPQHQKELAIYPGASHIDASNAPSGNAIEFRGPKRRARTSLAHESYL